MRIISSWFLLKLKLHWHASYQKKKMAGILKFQHMKNMASKISVITCYDYWSAKIIDETNIDAILVGDTLTSVMHGYPSTTSGTIDLMCPHVSAVARGAKRKPIIGDMPFLSYRKGLKHSMECALRLIQSGAHAVKLEGSKGNLELISHTVESGIPVMGHLGLLPQHVNKLGNFKVQGKLEGEAEELLKSAVELEKSGCFSIVLDCIPAKLAKLITEAIQIPTVGIGAGPHVSGQVLVLQDMLGMDCNFNPKFLKKYLDGHSLLKHAFNKYDEEVKLGSYPHKDHCYH